MSAITFVNDIPASIAATAEFRLFQGTHQIARIGVHAGGQVAVPTATSWNVQAFTSMGELSLSSNEVAVEGTSMRLLAHLSAESDFHDFQLVASPGLEPSVITLENTWRAPVQFKLTRPDSPIEIVTVVDEHNNTEISTAQQWTAYAIINGITMPTVTVTDPNATITATAGNSGDFTLVVS